MQITSMKYFVNTPSPEGKAKNFDEVILRAYYYKRSIRVDTGDVNRRLRTKVLVNITRYSPRKD